MKTLAARHVLERAIPFLVTRAGVRMGNAFSRALKPFGVSLSEWRVCASQQLFPRQALSEPAAHSSADLSALSRIVDRLVAHGLVVREQCGSDGRAVRTPLTQQGPALTRRIIPLAQHHAAVTLSDFSAPEIKMLRTMLTHL